MERLCDEMHCAPTTHPNDNTYIIHLAATFLADDAVRRRAAGEKQRRVNTRRYHV
jgi:hypothetical protein